MELLELWQIAKLVLKQIVKAHGPLVFMARCITFMFKYCGEIRLARNSLMKLTSELNYGKLFSVDCEKYQCLIHRQAECMVSVHLHTYGNFVDKAPWVSCDSNQLLD